MWGQKPPFSAALMHQKTQLEGQEMPPTHCCLLNLQQGQTSWTLAAASVARGDAAAGWDKGCGLTLDIQAMEMRSESRSV
jgi:hypothetical protein